jgi:hypothetical protein
VHVVANFLDADVPTPVAKTAMVVTRGRESLEEILKIIEHEQPREK